MTQTLSEVTHTVSLTVSELSWGRERAQQGAAGSATAARARAAGRVPEEADIRARFSSGYGGQSWSWRVGMRQG